jgi:putative transposase
MSTYSQIYIQVVFGVKHRNGLISPVWEDELYKYITGIIQQKGQKVIAINGTADHLHILIGMKPSCNLSDLVREFKKASSVFIREKGFSPYKFEWQEGFGAFSYSHSALDSVIRYINNQKEHHKKSSFKDEYLEFLEKFKVDYKNEYLPKFMDE